MVYDHEVCVLCDPKKVDEMREWAAQNSYGKFISRWSVPFCSVTFQFERHDDKVHFALKYA